MVVAFQLDVDQERGVTIDNLSIQCCIYRSARPARLQIVWRPGIIEVVHTLNLIT